MIAAATSGLFIEYTWILRTPFAIRSMIWSVAYAIPACFIAAGEGRGEARALFHQQIHELTQGDVVKRGIKDADVAVGEALRRGARRDQLTARFGKALLESRLLVQNPPHRRGDLAARDAEEL